MAMGGRRPGAGRKKGFRALNREKALAYISKRVSDELGPIMDKAIVQATSGDQTTRKDLLDRAYGKPVESVELTGKDGEPIRIEAAVRQTIDKVYGEGN